ncbi:MAG TPA: methyltransferase, partial [bacterium]|nr:methyltransferase [bacterium]
MTPVTIRIPGTDTHLQMKQKGLPVNQEALFLMEFLHETNIRPRRAAADLGCGSGLLTVALALLYPGIPVTGYEIQHALCDTARENVYLNGMDARVEVVPGDIRKPEDRPGDLTCDLVVMNPPFRTVGSGRVSPDSLRRSANHELCGTLEDFVTAASIALVHKGVLATVMLPERFPELLQRMHARKIPAFAARWIHHRMDLPANAVLILGRKGGRGGFTVYPPRLVTTPV